MIYIQPPSHPIENESWSHPEYETIVEALYNAYRRGLREPKETADCIGGYMLSNALRKELRHSVNTPEALLELCQTILPNFPKKEPIGHTFEDFIIDLDSYVTYERNEADQPSREG